jgi:hypothetical protein
LGIRRRHSKKLEAVKIPASSTFPIDQNLMERQREAARAHPIESIKPLVKAKQ